MSTRARPKPRTAGRRPARVGPAPLRWLVQGAASVVRGDRPLALVVLASLLLSVFMLTGPLQSYLDARERVEVLELKDEVLAAEIERLEQRVDDLHDPDRIELIAREQGFVRPGEVAYVIIPPDDDRPRITPVHQVSTPDPRWYERVWHWLTVWRADRS